MRPKIYFQVISEKKTGLPMSRFQGQDIFWHSEYQNQGIFQMQIEEFYWTPDLKLWKVKLITVKMLNI